MGKKQADVSDFVEIVDSVEVKVEKQKLTLGVNKEVIEKAKAAGINISEITEQLLTAMTFDPKGNTREDVITAYEMFFNAIKGLLRKYGTSVEVGRALFADSPDESGDEWRFVLGEEGLWRDPVNDFVGNPEDVTTAVAVHHLHDPKRILEDLISSLTEAAGKNKQKLAELDFARRLVRSLDDEDSVREKK